MPGDSPIGIIYSGAFKRSMDAKNRVTIPADWLEAGKENRFFSVPNPRGEFLLVMPPAEFDRVAERIKSRTDISPADQRNAIRKFFSEAHALTTDKQGRVLLPEEHCRRTGLVNEVCVIGAHSQIEIWSGDRWQANDANATESYEKVADLIGL